MKLKVLGLGLLAILAMSATAVMNAGAETGGHFVSEQEHTILAGTETEHTRLIDHHTGNVVSCPHTTPTYHGTTTSATVTEVNITPTYPTNCTDGSGHTVHVDMNGCTYKFTIGKKVTGDNTVHLVCPGAGPQLTITGPFGTCTVDITPNQTLSGGVAYETGGTSGSGHDIVANVTVSGIHMIYTGGFFLCEAANETTSNTGTLVGKVTIQGKDTAGNPVGITAT